MISDVFQYINILIFFLQMGGLECVITGLMDEFKTLFEKLHINREMFTGMVITVSFLVALSCVTPVKMQWIQILFIFLLNLFTKKSHQDFKSVLHLFIFQGGIYVFTMLENYVAGLSLLTTVFFEAIAVSWIYGK